MAKVTLTIEDAGEDEITFNFDADPEPQTADDLTAATQIGAMLLMVLNQMVEEDEPEPGTQLRLVD